MGEMDECFYFTFLHGWEYTHIYTFPSAAFISYIFVRTYKNKAVRTNQHSDTKMEDRCLG